MKKFNLFFLATIVIAALGLASCANGDNAADNKGGKAKAKTENGNLPNYRYVDIDSVLSKYNLAKDINEEMLRMETNMQSAVKQHEAKIQNFAAGVKNKMQNNAYLSEASYRQDEATMQNMQAEAQRSIAALQNNYQNAALKGQQSVIDSIKAFIKDYNKTRNYDAILQKQSTLYINPDLDITEEIIEGLNARYNKVKK